MSGYRLKENGKPLRFTFDGKSYTGVEGDTLASALMAAGVDVLARSFKYHRPRGIAAAGVEEPCTLVTLRGDAAGGGARREPNIPATSVELYDGLVAESQNLWPSLDFDLQAVNGLLSKFLVSGFYYKTFMGPTRKSWMTYEHFIRKAAGLGSASLEPDPDRYEKSNLFCDVLVVGAGETGRAAARAAGMAGARVVLAELDSTAAPFADLPNVRVMTRTTVYGYYDHNTLGAVERVCDHLPVPPDHLPRQRHWTIRAGRVVLATGALERPVVFAGNDIPGVMLAGAARSYVERFGVAPGRRVAFFTNNDSAYEAARVLAEAGVEIAAIIDSRAETPASEQRVIVGHAVVRARGGKRVKTIDIAPVGGGATQSLAVDTLAVSGGWSPTLHLHSQAGGPLIYDADLAAFLPGDRHQDYLSAGACAGQFSPRDAVAAGHAAGAEAARSLGFDGDPAAAPEAEHVPYRIEPLWEVPRPAGVKGKAFVDPQGDVTADDVRLAEREGYRSVEHLKRYTTLGMATDQGKFANVNAIAIMAAARGQSIPETGTTRFRPPYTPVTIGTLAGRNVGAHLQPVRRTPMHDWHVSNGAEMMTVGAWMRPRIYPKPGETVEQAYVRECRHVRDKVGLVDVSTLGKIDVQGTDAAEFLNRVYSNGFAKLPVGKARYGLMLREDGIVYDDGTTWRLAEHQFLMTTTTANAAGVLQLLEHLLDVVWPDLRVAVASVTEQWAAAAISGPDSRRVLEAALSDIDLSEEGLPFMGVAQAKLEDVDVWVARLSFSGERAYEVYAPAHAGDFMWRRLMAAGEAFDMIPYGMEALGALRIEKGHVAGPELDGRTTAADLGLGRMASTKKTYVGCHMMDRPGLTDEARPKLVGLISRDGTALRAGSHLVDAAQPGEHVSLGHVTSVTYSPVLEKYIALGLLRHGPERHGDTVYAASPVHGLHQAVEVVSPHMVDPEGERLHA